jgi:hypothetical protein
MSGMTPQHDEILKRLDDGLVVAWDTTRIGPAKLREMRIVGAQQAAELGRIFGVDDVPLSESANRSADTSPD